MSDKHFTSLIISIVGIFLSLISIAFIPVGYGLVAAIVVIVINYVVRKNASDRISQAGMLVFTTGVGIIACSILLFLFAGPFGILIFSGWFILYPIAGVLLIMSGLYLANNPKFS